MKNKNLTIDIVSKKANVSKATVSRYINEKYEYMSQETKNRIKSVIEELGYRPNIIAQNLKSKKSGLIGVIVSDITSPFSSILLKGIIDTCTKEGYQVIVASIDDKPENEPEYIMSMLDRQVEGIIINTTGNNEEFLETLKSKEVIIVLADRPMRNCIFDTVTTDNENMTAKAIKTLYSCGFERVAFFSEDINKSIIRFRRFTSFIDVSKNYVNNPNDLVYVINDYNKDKECIQYKKGILDFLNTSKKNAIFAVNGVTMLNLLNALKKLNLIIPYDVGVCGYDDWGWANLVGSGGISVVSQPSYNVGMKSAELLLNRIKYGNNYKNPMYIELTSQLILRGSTNSNLIYKKGKL